MKNGIDVSSHNGTINWAKVKAAGVKFAILRCGYGDNISSQDDSQFSNNVNGCISNGIPYAVYLYSYAIHSSGSQSIESEINHVKRLISGKKPFCVYIDMEDSSTQNLGKTTLTNFAIQFCDAIQKAGYKAGIYANKNWLTNYLNASTLYNKGYSIWIAQYNNTCTYTTTGYDIWQYSSTGSCDGISSSGLDMNYMYNDITNGSTVIQPPPKISVTYQVYDDVNKVFLSNVTDTQDYAGLFGHDIDCVYANLSQGNITYRVHYKGGSWLPQVTNRNDYAGIMGKPIDGLMMTTNTGKTIHYRVHLRRSNTWLSYVTGYNTNDSNNGYAGIIGQEIDAIQIYLG